MSKVAIHVLVNLNIIFRIPYGQFHENVDTALKIQLDLTVFFAFLR